MSTKPEQMEFNRLLDEHRYRDAAAHACKTMTRFDCSLRLRQIVTVAQINSPPEALEINEAYRQEQGMFFRPIDDQDEWANKPTNPCIRMPVLRPAADVNTDFDDAPDTDMNIEQPVFA